MTKMDKLADRLPGLFLWLAVLLAILLRGKWTQRYTPFK